MPNINTSAAVAHLPPAVAYGMNNHDGAKPSAQASRSVPAPPAVIPSTAHAPRAESAPAVQQALVASAQAKAASAPLAEVALPNRDGEALRLLDKLDAAKNANVDLSKRNFFMKCASVAASATIVAIAIAATVLSFGLASVVTAPVIALTSVNLATSVGDAVCCYKNWQAAKDQANGGSRERLIGGDSCVTHAAMTLCRAVQRKVGGSQETADQVAKGLSVGFKVGMGVATAFFCAGIGGAAHIAKIGFYVTKGMSMAINLSTVALRGIHERQFLSNVQRSERLQDLYKTEIPREGPRMQRMNSVANDGLRLMMRDPNAFTSTLAVASSPLRQATVRELNQLLERDAAVARNVGRSPGVDQVEISAERAQHFTRFTQGATADMGNAALATAMTALAVAGLLPGEVSAAITEMVSGLV